MENFTLSGTSVALSTTGYAVSVTGAAFTLTSTTVSDGLAHKVTVLNNTATNHTGKTIAIVGTDADGKAQSETITGPNNAATVTSTLFYLTLTSVTPSATIGADTFSIGYNASSVTPSFRPSRSNMNSFNLGMGTRVVSGSPTFSVQHTYGGGQWFEHSVITGKSAATDGVYTSPIMGLRLAFTVAGGAAVDGVVL